MRAAADSGDAVRCHAGGDEIVGDRLGAGLRHAAVGEGEPLPSE